MPERHKIFKTRFHHSASTGGDGCPPPELLQS
jgi:hypothetical protein